MLLDISRIEISDHASERLSSRCAERSLPVEEAIRRVYLTIINGSLSPNKHRSKKHRTYMMYFPDGLCFYVICKESHPSGEPYLTVVTVIIEEGRP